MGCTLLAGGCGDGVSSAKLPVLWKKKKTVGREMGQMGGSHAQVWLAGWELMVRCGSSGWEIPLRCGLVGGGGVHAQVWDPTLRSPVQFPSGNTEYNP